MAIDGINDTRSTKHPQLSAVITQSPTYGRSWQLRLRLQCRTLLELFHHESQTSTNQRTSLELF